MSTKDVPPFHPPTRTLLLHRKCDFVLIMSSNPLYRLPPYSKVKHLLEDEPLGNWTQGSNPGRASVTPADQVLEIVELALGGVMG